MTAYTRSHLRSRWQTGECGTYAYALVTEYPHLRFGVAVTDAWDVLHFFAHDATTAYDSLGAHPMPYLGPGTYPRFDHALDDIDPGYWGLLVDAAAGAPEGDKSLREALTHIRRHGIGPQAEARDRSKPESPRRRDETPMPDYGTEAVEAMRQSGSHAHEAQAALDDAFKCLASGDTGTAMRRVARAETELQRAREALRDVRWKVKQVERERMRA